MGFYVGYQSSAAALRPEEVATLTLEEEEDNWTRMPGSRLAALSLCEESLESAGESFQSQSFSHIGSVHLARAESSRLACECYLRALPAVRSSENLGGRWED